MRVFADGTPEDLGGGPSLGSVALMGALDEPVGPCVPGSRSGMANVELVTHLVELPFEFASAIG